MKTYIENAIEEMSYEDLGNWCLPDIEKFSDSKILFEYQRIAIKNATKVLHTYFKAENGKQALFSACTAIGLDITAFSIPKYSRRADRIRRSINKRFSLFQNHYKTLGVADDEHILGNNFFNRVCFWMATGSGKSLVLIKIIELLDFLQSQQLIPKKEIMLLLPREDLIKQFKKEINDYNKGRDKQIELVNLREYEEDKQTMFLFESIKVYYYRSDLLRAERKETILDYRSYENNGNWYVFLDEAHRGEKENSLMQDYVSILSKNGFSFNFSATFTDPIDYTTTCYNFNLEKFINAGYGKNLYLSQSYFSFTKDRDDFSEHEKQKQVLKSLITFSLVKRAKPKEMYHHPLLITLVNSINTDESDLLLLFQKLEEIAGGKLNNDLFMDSKNEVRNDLMHKSYVFGDEQLKFNSVLLANMQIKDLLKSVFNSNNYGKIEILEGEKGKEIVLKLETSAKPFALIKIGDTGKFQREKLGDNYSVVSGFYTKKYFENINNDDNINLLLGSRSFYEGWDSNRPNVINFINIGGQDAKKFVLQGIGRGIRIEPTLGERKRLPFANLNKSVLLETLFVFATDKSAVKAIMETVEEQKNTDEVEISLFENTNKSFDLLIPTYREASDRARIGDFNIAKDSLENFKKYFDCFDKNVMLIKTGISESNYSFLKQGIDIGTFFQSNSEKTFSDMEMLLQKLIAHISKKNKVVDEIIEVTDEINHFRHIKVDKLNEEDIKSFRGKVQKVKDFKVVNKKALAAELLNGTISEEEFTNRIASTNEEDFNDLKIIQVAKHYYLPLIYSEQEKVEYIKHIICIESEVKFVKNLINYIKDNIDNFVNEEWMFSKLVENIDKLLYIPYFYKKENIYRKFFPDFIFWIKKNKDYRIIFVDPKGTGRTEYTNKVDEFEKLFYKNDIPMVFNYNDLKIIFDLKLIADDINEVPEKYKKYWLGNDDFSWL